MSSRRPLFEVNEYGQQVRRVDITEQEIYESMAFDTEQERIRRAEARNGPFGFARLLASIDDCFGVPTDEQMNAALDKVQVGVAKFGSMSFDELEAWHAASENNINSTRQLITTFNIQIEERYLIIVICAYALKSFIEEYFHENRDYPLRWIVARSHMDDLKRRVRVETRAAAKHIKMSRAYLNEAFSRHCFNEHTEQGLRDASEKVLQSISEYNVLVNEARRYYSDEERVEMEVLSQGAIPRTAAQPPPSARAKPLSNEPHQ